MKLFINAETNTEIFQVDAINVFKTFVKSIGENTIAFRIFSAPIVPDQSKGDLLLQFVINDEDKCNKDFDDRINKTLDKMKGLCKELNKLVVNLFSKSSESDEYIINIYNYITPEGYFSTNYKIDAKKLKKVGTIDIPNIYGRV